MRGIKDKGCHNCKYMDQPGHMPPCDKCADPAGFGLNGPPRWERGRERSGVRGQGSVRGGRERSEVRKKGAAVRALWVVIETLHEAAERMEQVRFDQGYILHAAQLRGAATMAKEWIEGIEGEMEREARGQGSEVRKKGGEGMSKHHGRTGTEISPGGWVRMLDEDDGYCD